ncbi:small RNA degrading nuclease 1-like [Cicer arietinum]|uniref:Small RNA degrading nuclease 1-like n=1 Tax=Cicer arietinum TaxID=3827 RepID=A0A1S2Y6B8_CICAR|nr:small RNA degrading nuclease 1-like [Cicer arietinum]
MEYKIDTADKKVLVDIVKLAQKRGMKGKMGDWKEFLSSHDKQFGARMSDPSKKPHEVLAAFLKTFSKDEDLKFFNNVMKHHSNQYILERLKERSHDSPEQSLVQETLQHPLYPLDYSFPSIDEGWLVISLKRKSKGVRSTTMLAVDCEMVLCEDGTEALVKVCVVDHNLEVKLHKLVKPDKSVIDYRTEITGVSSEDLKTVTCSLADIQKSLRKLIDGNILVGHSLYNDLRVLKIDYVRVIDTAYIFKPVDGSIHRRPSLNSLCQSVLGYEVRQKDAPHDCLDDASATMKLVLARIKHGVDKPFPLTLVQEQVSESEMTKLLLHRIPTTVNKEALHEIIPGDFTLEVKPPRNGQGDIYSAVAIFKNHQEAGDAYESFQGSLTKDSNGRPQKSVTFRLSTGTSVSLFVRRLPSHAHRKRDFQVDGTDDVSKNKKIKMDPEVEKDALNAVDDSKEVKVDPEIEKEIEDAHLKEIEALNQQLKERELEIESLKEQLRKKDFEITTLHNMVAKIKKRQPKIR